MYRIKIKNTELARHLEALDDYGRSIHEAHKNLMYAFRAINTKPGWIIKVTKAIKNANGKIKSADMEFIDTLQKYGNDTSSMIYMKRYNKSREYLEDHAKEMVKAYEKLKSDIVVRTNVENMGKKFLKLQRFETEAFGMDGRLRILLPEDMQERYEKVPRE